MDDPQTEDLTLTIIALKESRRITNERLQELYQLAYANGKIPPYTLLVPPGGYTLTQVEVQYEGGHNGMELLTFTSDELNPWVGKCISLWKEGAIVGHDEHDRPLRLTTHRIKYELDYTTTTLEKRILHQG